MWKTVLNYFTKLFKNTKNRFNLYLFLHTILHFHTSLRCSCSFWASEISSSVSVLALLPSLSFFFELLTCEEFFCSFGAQCLLSHKQNKYQPILNKLFHGTNEFLTIILFCNTNIFKSLINHIRIFFKFWSFQMFIRY